MKKLLFASAVLCSFCLPAIAQRLTPEQRERLTREIAHTAAKVTMSTDKSVLEPQEATAMTVGIELPPKYDSDGDIVQLPDWVPLQPGPDSPWRITNWRVVEGGGDIVNVDDGSISYTAPAAEPRGDTMTVSVDLIPQMSGFPKVTLLQKLYYIKAEQTAIYVNMPQIGLNFTKYVSKMNAGATVPTMQGVDPRAAAAMPPDIQAKMAQARAAMAGSQASTGINVSAVSSNAMSLYDPEHKQTAVKFTSLNVQMENGIPANKPSMTAFLEFNFKGKGVGTYSLKDDGTGAGLFIPAMRNGVGCGSNARANSKQDMPCTGGITITSVDDRFVKGIIRTAVYTSVEQNVYRGYLYGKFTVKRAR